MKLKQKLTDPMEEAYKLLDGEPAIDAVSQAAKGLKPESDAEQRVKNHDAEMQRRGLEQGCSDVQEAYARLFDSLADIMRLA